MDIVSKDLISYLPEDLICHILSFLPTGESALTSLLSNKWRYLFAFSPNLDFDDLKIYLQCEKRALNRHRLFMDFVDRVLRLRGNCTINKFSFNCRAGDNIDPARLSRLITNVIEHGVSDLELNNTNRRPVDDSIWISGSVLVSKSLVRLAIHSFCFVLINGKDIFLPNLKTLHLYLFDFGDCDNLVNLVSACHVLEELVLMCISWKYQRNCSVSSKTLKRLWLHSIHSIGQNNIPKSVSFDTPNLVFLNYSDQVAEKYKPMNNLDSLVEARIELALTSDQRTHASHGDMVCNVTNLLIGISNVQFLHLLEDTLEVVTLCREQIPVFKNLVSLTIQIHRKSGWESLPALLKNCPNLETLVFDRVYHECTIECGCLCKIAEEILTCLSSSSVKFLVMSRSGGSDVVNYIEQQVKQFLETMPRVEKLTIHYDTKTYEYMIQLSSQLKNLTRVTLQKCELLEIYSKSYDTYFAYIVITFL